MSEFVDLAGTKFQLTHGQSTGEDRESLEFREPGNMLDYVFEVALYGNRRTGDLRIADVDELPVDVVLAAIEFSRKYFAAS